MHNASRWPAILFWGFVGLYSVLLLIQPALGPSDDFIFLRTLESGKPLLYYSASFPYYNSIEIGRFTPLTGMEYNLVGIFSKTPTAYFLIHVIELILFLVLAEKILSRVVQKKSWIYGILGALMLTPGFVFSWFKLQMNERNVLLFFAIFLFSYTTYTTTEKKRWLFLSLLTANIAIYFKETAFIAIGIFACFELFFQKKPPMRKLLYALLGSIVLFLLLYGILVLPHGGVFVYGKAPHAFLALIKNIFNYAFVSDPFFMLIFFPLGVVRLVNGLRTKVWHTPYDAMLFASLAYASAFFVLNLHGVHYFLPAYVFGIPAIIFYFKDYISPSLKARGVFYAASALFILNTIPMGIHEISYQKNLSSNFEKTISFLSATIKNNQQKTRIFFDGLHKGSGNWNYFIISEYLLHSGVSPEQFDLASNIEDGTPPSPLPVPVPNILLPYSVFQKTPTPTIARGDYLVVSPIGTDAKKNNEDKAFLENLSQNYKLLFVAKSNYDIPLFTIKEAGRLLLSRNSTPGGTFLGISRKSPQKEITDFYVFMHT